MLGRGLVWISTGFLGPCAVRPIASPIHCALSPHGTGGLVTMKKKERKKERPGEKCVGGVVGMFTSFCIAEIFGFIGTSSAGARGPTFRCTGTRNFDIISTNFSPRISQLQNRPAWHGLLQVRYVVCYLVLTIRLQFRCPIRVVRVRGAKRQPEAGAAQPLSGDLLWPCCVCDGAVPCPVLSRDRAVTVL